MDDSALLKLREPLRRWAGDGAIPEGDIRQVLIGLAPGTDPDELSRRLLNGRGRHLPLSGVIAIGLTQDELRAALADEAVDYICEDRLLWARESATARE